MKTLRRPSRTFRDAANFYVNLDDGEQWSILDVSRVGHPIHLHLVHFQVLSRDGYDLTGFDVMPKEVMKLDPHAHADGHTAPHHGVDSTAV